MHDACERLWKFDDAATKPEPDTADPLEAGCARALADVLKYDTDSNYATMAAREFLAMWRFVMRGVEEGCLPIDRQLEEAEDIGRIYERARITQIIGAMITERLRFIGLLSPECARERTLALGALQEVLDALDPCAGPMKPPPVAACMKVAA